MAAADPRPRLEKMDSSTFDIVQAASSDLATRAQRRVNSAYRNTVAYVKESVEQATTLQSDDNRGAARRGFTVDVGSGPSSPKRAVSPKSFGAQKAPSIKSFLVSVRESVRVEWGEMRGSQGLTGLMVQRRKCESERERQN